MLRSYKATGLLSDELSLWLEMAEELGPDDYRQALQRREDMRSALEAIRPLADAMITLSSPGPAPPLDFPADSGEAAYAFKTGSPSFNAATSALGTPAITVPLTSIGGLPMGVQLIGYRDQDWHLTGNASWLMNNIGPISV